MHDSRGRLLIVDDDVSMRASFSLIFAELGYEVRSCGDGVSAQSEIWKEIPDILLSSLEPALMSGLDFLAAVRCRFPSIRVIAMGAALSGNSIPAGVAADAFYQNGAGLDRLIEILDSLTMTNRSNSRLS